MNIAQIESFQIHVTFHERRGPHTERVEGRGTFKDMLASVRYSVDQHNINGRCFRIYAIVGGRRIEITEDQLNALD
jgi:hypothetical protein